MIKQLQSFGLSEKEAKVYVACLELAKSTVQDISRKANVNRATTYVQLESLKARGLVSQIIEDKKSLFIAESPENVNKMIEKEKVDVMYKEKEFNKILPNLKAIYNLAADRPNVRFFEGDESIANNRDEIFNSHPQAMYGLTPFVWPEEYDYTEKQAREIMQQVYPKIKQARVIYLDKEPRPYLHDIAAHIPSLEIRYFPLKKLNIETEIIVADNRIWISNIKGKPFGVLIEDKIIAQTFVSIFMVIWESAQP